MVNRRSEHKAYLWAPSALRAANCTAALAAALQSPAAALLQLAVPRTAADVDTLETAAGNEDDLLMLLQLLLQLPSAAAGRPLNTAEAFQHSARYDAYNTEASRASTQAEATASVSELSEQVSFQLSSSLLLLLAAFHPQRPLLSLGTLPPLQQRLASAPAVLDAIRTAVEALEKGPLTQPIGFAILQWTLDLIATTLFTLTRGAQFPQLELEALCRLFADAFDPAHPGLTVLLMQKALDAIRFRAEAVGAPEALLLLRGIRKLQVTLPSKLHAPLTIDLPLLQLQLWPSLRSHFLTLPTDSLLEVAAVYLHSAFVAEVLYSGASKMQTLPYGSFQYQCARLEPYAASLVLGSPLQHELLRSIDSRLSTMELHHAAALCRTVLGLSPAAQLPTNTLPEIDGGSMTVLWEFGSAFLQKYFGTPTRASEAGAGFTEGLLEGSSSRTAVGVAEHPHGALQPEHLLAGRQMLRCLSTDDFVDIIRVMNGYGYRNESVERLLLQEAAERLETPLSPSSVSALLQLPTPRVPPPALVRAFELQLQRFCDNCTALEPLLQLSASLHDGWRGSLLSRFRLQHHVERLAAASLPESSAPTEATQGDVGPWLLLQHVPSLLAFVSKSEDGARGSFADPCLLAAGETSLAQRGGSQGSSVPTVSPAKLSPSDCKAAEQPPPAALSLALRVLLPALYTRHLQPEDLGALLCPLAQCPLLGEYVAAARETAPQSRLALLPDAIGNLILQISETTMDGIQHISPLLRLIKILGMDSGVYVHPLLSALQRSSLQSLHFEDATDLLSALLQSRVRHEPLLQRLISWLSSTLVAAPVLPASASVALLACLRCCSGLGYESEQLVAVACSLLQQWQQQKYGNHSGIAPDRQQQQLLEGGLTDETEVSLLHCLLTGEHFSDTATACFRLCVENIRDGVQAARVRGGPPPHSPALYYEVYEATLALQELASRLLALNSKDDEALLAFCQHDLPKAFWHRRERLLLESFLSSPAFVEIRAALTSANLQGLQPLITSCGFCHFAATAKPGMSEVVAADVSGTAKKQADSPVAGLALVCVPEEETLLLPQQCGTLLLLHQQHLQRSCGRSRLLLRLLHQTGWASVPIWMDQWRQLPDAAARVSYLRALTNEEDA
ncbi:hypothetical protein cyc_03073 [Cyclospora cayetanensis]|uniref:Uncharacterized protein n=1 Tax=Cyclospora cayetanensis TaxID=88456 RepID=A0A1D3D5I4_9EIME|nr:hypothetical protein cyc_03073 [Cyclospora cayetanensis]